MSQNESKVCKRGLNDIWINEADGNVRMCGWTNFYLGNLKDNTIEEIWNGELANKFRQSMLDGSYRYCNHSKCPHCANNQLDQMLVTYEVPEYPTYCSLSYQLQCNYQCKFCRTEKYIPCENERKNYIKIENEVKKLLPYLKTLSSNGAGEFFCSDSIIKLLSTEKLNEDMDILLETNGSLFNPNNWEKINNLGNHNLQVAVTVHSFNESTYQYLSGTNINVNQVIDNLRYISELRSKEIVNKFEIATVICERNFREMPEFVRKCLSEFAMDTIRLRFFESYGVMDVNTEWFYDVRNKMHPYHDEFEKVMSDPIFENEKVWKWQGDTESLQSESPYVLKNKTLSALCQIIIDKNKLINLKKYLKNNNIERIAIYGASDTGKALSKILYDNGICVKEIFDSFVQETTEENYNIIRPSEESVNKYELIVVSSDVSYSNIEETLRRKQYRGIIKSISELIYDLN